MAIRGSMTDVWGRIDKLECQIDNIHQKLARIETNTSWIKWFVSINTIALLSIVVGLVANIVK